MVQTKKGIKNDEFFILNKDLNERIVINEKGAYLLRKLYKAINEKRDISKLINRNKEFFQVLIDSKVLVCGKNETNKNVFISKKTPRLPLSSINLEITDGCNLKCIHCYDDFGSKKITFIDKNEIFNLLDEMNELNTFSVAITGGESTIHPDFLEIASFFIERGFEVTIFTNGFNYHKILELLAIYPNKKLRIKVSLDGFEKEHNEIRRNMHAYLNCIKLLDELKKAKNCVVFISTIVMKENLENSIKFEEYITKEYPNFYYSADLITPCPTNKNHSFNLSDFDSIYKKYPKLFEFKENESNSIYRCSGGISQCTLMADGNLKICNGAVDEVFKFKYNVFKNGLKKSWLDCGDNIKKYRKEKKKTSIKCRACSLKDKCFLTDCRIISKSFVGSEDLPNPVVCFAMNKKYKGSI